MSVSVTLVNVRYTEAETFNVPKKKLYIFELEAYNTKARIDRKQSSPNSI